MSGDSVTRRFKWDDIQVFPGNPILGTRLSQMEKRWGGYIPQVVGVPLVADNTAGAFPEYGPDAIVMVDGHHRMALAKNHDRGAEEIICELKRGESREALHRIFQQYNDSRSVNHAEKFLHRIGEGDTKACGIYQLVKDAGYELTISPANSADKLNATSPLEWIWDGGDKLLQRKRGKGPHRAPVVMALSGYRSLTEGHACTQQAALLKALGAFYLRYPDADAERLLDRLQDRYGSVSKILGAAKQAKNDFGIPNNYEAFGFIAGRAYNGNRQGKHTLPEWR